MKYKIIVTGPVGSGKTTAINSLTNDDAFVTDVLVSDNDEVTSQRKLNTTVAMDFGVVQVGEDMAYVYGTPGQQRFNFMWDILSQGARGIIILLDTTRNYPFRDLKYYVDSFSDLIASNKLIVGVTRSDESNEVPLSTYQLWLKELNLDAEVRFIDARKKSDVEQLVHTLVADIIATAEKTVIMKESNVVSENASAVADMSVKDDIIEKSSVNLVDVEPPAASLDEVLELNETSLQQVATLKGVNGVTLTNSIGELLHSTINDDDINEFIAFLSGITPVLEDATNMGAIHRIMLRGPHDENLTVFVEEERSLGISSNKAVSVPALSQKIEDMLQWG